MLSQLRRGPLRNATLVTLCLSCLIGILLVPKRVATLFRYYCYHFDYLFFYIIYHFEILLLVPYYIVDLQKLHIHLGIVVCFNNTNYLYTLIFQLCIIIFFNLKLVLQEFFNSYLIIKIFPHIFNMQLLHLLLIFIFLYSHIYSKIHPIDS